VPTKETPVIIQGKKYLRGRQWQQVEFPRSERSVIYDILRLSFDEYDEEEMGFFRGGAREVTGSQKEKHEEEENTIAVKSIEPRRLVGGNTNNRVVSGLPLAFLIDVFRCMRVGNMLIKEQGESFVRLAGVSAWEGTKCCTPYDLVGHALP
jgi:hypothetical protein